MAKRRRTVNNDHYTLVVTKRALGLYWHIRLVANYKEGIEETLMHSENYFNKSNAVRAVGVLSKNLNIRVVIE